MVKKKIARGENKSVSIFDKQKLEENIGMRS
jgi:hypothetical protein